MPIPDKNTLVHESLHAGIMNAAKVPEMIDPNGDVYIETEAAIQAIANFLKPYGIHDMMFTEAFGGDKAWSKLMQKT